MRSASRRPCLWAPGPSGMHTIYLLSIPAHSLPRLTFTLSLPCSFFSLSYRPLSASLVQEVVTALRAADPRVVQYATWVTQAWKILQWGEPTARLLWEMLMLFSFQGEQPTPQPYIHTDTGVIEPRAYA